jgi:hypothetical protein
MCSWVSLMRWMSRKRGAMRARVPGSVVGGAFAQKFHVQAALLPGLAQGGRFRVFLQLDVSSQRQPFAEFAMVDEQDLAIADDEDRHGEIDFFVNVRHKIGRVWRD